jgi:hypothetical protein
MRKFYYELKLNRLLPQKEKIDKELVSLDNALDNASDLTSWTSDNSCMDIFMPLSLMVGYISSIFIQMNFFHIGLIAVAYSFFWTILFPPSILLVLGSPWLILKLIQMPLKCKKVKVDALVSSYQKEMLKLGDSSVK